MVGLYLDTFVEFLVRVVMRMVQLRRSNSWQTVTGKVIAACYKKSSGCDIAEISYNYQVDGEYYAGKYVNPFISNVHGEE